MTGVGARFDSLRLSSPEMRRLGLALALSLGLHLFAWGGYEAGKQLGWSQRLHLPAWLHLVPKMKTGPLAVPQNNEEQLMFVEVAQPTTEAPQNTKYYSSQNSRAADPTMGNKDVPQLNGKQTEIAKTENVLRPDFNKLQPARPAQQQELKPAVQPGDLTLGKPQDTKPQEQPRPRTLKQASEQQAHQMPGPQMKQEGGMHRHALVPSFDVRATPFGEYDAVFFEAVQQYWNDELYSQQFAMDRTGRVTIQFNLNYDGTVTDVKILSNTVGVLLGSVCQNAIEVPAPFARWPEGMRREIGRNYRQITVTFIYY
jgi:outer membrane biosynthesis protein TonB